MVLDATIIAEIKTYHDKYYNRSFVWGQGTEHILGFLNGLRINGAWADIGCGTNTLFWAIPLLRNDFTSVVVSDFYPEALSVLADFKMSSALPECYREVMAIHSADETEFFKFRNRAWEMYLSNAFEAWVPPLGGRRYGLITQFGCFGVASSAVDFHNAIDFAVANLDIGGYLVGANWKRSLKYVQAKGGDNSFLSPDLIQDYFNAHSGLELMINQQLSIRDDEFYDYVLLWSLKRRR